MISDWFDWQRIRVSGLRARKEGQQNFEPGAVCATPCLCPFVTPVKLSVVSLHNNLFHGWGTVSKSQVSWLGVILLC